MLHRKHYIDIKRLDKLGVMRVDWYNGYIANQWNPTEFMVRRKNKIDIDKLKEDINYLQFNLLRSFEKVIDLANGEGYDNETIIYYKSKFIFVIKLIPVKDTYSYIYVYII